jgi:hypothetical protein
VPLGNVVCALAGNPDAATATINAICRAVLQSNCWVMEDLPLLVEFSKSHRGYFLSGAAEVFQKNPRAFRKAER